MKTVTSTVYTNKLLMINILTKFHKDWMKTANSFINILTKFHKDWMKTVTSTVYTSDLINILTKFHKDWMKTATSIVYTSDLINILTKCHKDWMKIVTSTVYTKKLLTDTRTHTHTDAGHHTPYFSIKVTIFELIQNINKTNLMTKFGSHVFQAKVTICELIHDIIGKNLLSKFHEDRKINVALRVLTRKNAPPPGRHFHEDQTINVASREKCPAPWQPFFQANVNIFDHIQDIIETNLLTKFNEEWTINVSSRELTRQMLTPHNGRRTKRRSQKLTMSRLCSGELKRTGDSCSKYRYVVTQTSCLHTV
ncbi:hypothetical protein DPMN_103870 [Dreissena polymorpha]|uniref:Uncharacterized protein n=1 Tax=Dreissena polymorpha TaxID=45954 RepID=A0A9D4HAJ3_DREPO|nr:hypothetical protein DPMN_103870 [Dreissena polymorpha]